MANGVTNAELFKALRNVGVEESDALRLASVIPAAESLATKAEVENVLHEVRAVRDEQKRLADEAEREAQTASAIKNGRAEGIRTIAFVIMGGLLLGMTLIVLELSFFS